MATPRPEKVIVEIDLKYMRREGGLESEDSLTTLALLRVVQKIGLRGICPAGVWGSAVAGASWVVYPEGSDRCKDGGS